MVIRLLAFRLPGEENSARWGMGPRPEMGDPASCACWLLSVTPHPLEVAFLSAFPGLGPVSAHIKTASRCPGSECGGEVTIRTQHLSARPCLSHEVVSEEPAAS